VFSRGCFDPWFLFLIPPSIPEFHFDPLMIVRGVFKGVVVSFSEVVFVSYTPLGRKRTREEEEEGRLRGGDPKP
jgi:hypothetical protein